MRRGFFIVIVLIFISLPASAAECDLGGGNGTRPEGTLVYNEDHKALQFCNGTQWVAVGIAGPGVLDLADLTDVDDALAPADGEVLTYDNASGEWISGPAGGAGVEVDPEVGTLTATKWCISDGSVVNCTQDAPVLTETDPEVGTVTNNQWCRGDGSAVQCDQAAPSGDNLGNHEADEALKLKGFRIMQVGDPSNGDDAATKDYVDGLTGANETDPQVGTLEVSKWCAADIGGTIINCNKTAPVDDNLGNHQADQDLDMKNFKIKSVGNPSSSQDAATKAYVDGLIFSGTADADTLDGLDSLQFLRSDVADTGTDITLNSLTATSTNGILWENGVNRITHNDGGGNVQIRLGNEYSGGHKFTHGGGAVLITSNIDGTSNTVLSLSVSSNPGAGTGSDVSWGSALSITANDLTFGGATIWRADNDGSGSGLDADTLDGLNSSALGPDNLGSGGSTAGTLYSKNGSGYGYVGTDGNNYLRFDDNGVGSEIYVRLAGGWEYIFQTGQFRPYTDNASDLGTSGVKWQDIWTYDIMANRICNESGGSCKTPESLLTSENDPQVGVLSPGAWCAANALGSAIACNQSPPTTSLSCVTRTAAGTAKNCNAGETMTGGGCTFAGGTGGNSYPAGNGWRCGSGTVTTYVRCCS